MFRLSHGLRIVNGAAKGHARPQLAPRRVNPIVIWNLTRKCNLECVHCYSSSKSRDYHDELTTAEALRVIDDLREAQVAHLVFSGGEPLFRLDLMRLAEHAAYVGLNTSLSSNGTMIGEPEADRIKLAGFSYAGVSLDGVGEAHDRFRGMKGAFDKSVEGIMLCKERGIKSGVRFTLTKLNIVDLPRIFKFVESHDIDKLYLSHLVYSGRGVANKNEDLSPEQTREAMDFVFDKVEEYARDERPIEIVTGNNDADAVYFLMRVAKKSKEGAARLARMLLTSGGNSAGIGVANIDPRGEVHPDPLLSSINLGNVKDRPFGEIWFENNSPILAKLRKRPRELHGRCGGCAYLDMCGGNTRARAERMTGDLWGSDPACYLTDEEIKVEKMALAG